MKTTTHFTGSWRNGKKEQRGDREWRDEIERGEPKRHANPAAAVYRRIDLAPGSWRERLCSGETIKQKSGRADLNRGPHGPEPCALAKLRYAPNNLHHTIFDTFGKPPCRFLRGWYDDIIVSLRKYKLKGTGTVYAEAAEPR